MMIQAVLSNPSHPEYGVATIPFPIQMCIRDSSQGPFVSHLSHNNLKLFIEEVGIIF